MMQLLTTQLGTVPYGIALELQRDLARRRITGEIDEDMLLLLEHPPVVTLGRTAKEAHIVSSPERLRARGVEVHEVEREATSPFTAPASSSATRSSTSSGIARIFIGTSVRSRKR